MTTWYWPGRPNPAFPGFDAATQAGYVDIASIRVHGGQKKGPNHVHPDRSVSLTTPSCSPRHVADAVARSPTNCTSMYTALRSNNVWQWSRWNSTWDLKPGHPADEVRSFPSSGPYKIDPSGRWRPWSFVADRWWGTKAITTDLRLAAGAGIQDRVNNRSVDVVDVAAGSSGSW